MTNTPKHSPAPWTGNSKGEIFAPDGTIIAQVYDNPDTGMEAVDDEPSAHNIALIKAAPKLLAALRDCVDIWKILEPGDADRPVLKRAIEAISEAMP